MNTIRDSILALVHLQHCEECLLRDLDSSDLLHSTLALFLFFEELSLARDVAAVAFGDHVLAHRLDGLTGDDLVPDRSLDRDFEELTRDKLFHFSS